MPPSPPECQCRRVELTPVAGRLQRVWEAPSEVGVCSRCNQVFLPCISSSQAGPSPCTAGPL